MVGSGEYLWECLSYVELNMVRCGVVTHPADWSWSGYGELMGWRKRNQLLEQKKLLWLLRCEDQGAFRKQFTWWLEDAMINDWLRREAKWSEAIAVGDGAYVDAIERQIRGRQRLQVEEQGGSWTLRESYGPFSEPEKSPMNPLAGSILLQAPVWKAFAVVRPGSARVCTPVAVPDSPAWW